MKDPFKDITVVHTNGSLIREHGAPYYGYDILEVRHENKLTLDTITIAYHFGNLAQIQYTKPYFLKYLGLVVVWIVNNRPTFGNIKCTQNVAR